ncbi:DUF3302 domain-containing protein [Pseudomaricurvus sp. HS19]|uniref:DUF3302 domain-containing protein n=1 Tax=Pseudomaricurvus sp. HS19 TaxID=2692626 RepID=UPI00136E109D|nr:DUF3302 domain-containing protein [Pseudomaricurvus sp. HS19]
MFLDYFALFMVFFVAIFIFYAIIAIHDIPYDIARHRNHPHQDSIHVAGWISLFTLHLIWPFLWIWATLYREDRGWGFNHSNRPDSDIDADSRAQLESLAQQVTQLQAELQQLRQTRED